MVRSLAASLVAALVVWARIAWELRNVTDPPLSNFTGNWLCDCLMIAALANLPLPLLVFAERLRLRRLRRAWETTGIEFV